MNEKTKQRIEEIQKRLEEYKKYKNDPYSYYADEAAATRQLEVHAPEDIEFLLNLISSLEQKILRLRLEASYLRKGVPFKKIKL